MLDYLITGATVYDGVTDAPRRLSVGIKGERIAYVGPLLSTSAAERVIHAPECFLCPGFIDTHASTGLGYRFPHAGDNKLFQGVTTEIIGNCGTSTGPVGERLVPTMQRLAEQIGFSFDWRTLGEWFDRVEAYGLPFSVGTFVGHSTLRGGVCTDMQQVTRNDIDRMGAMVDQAMQDGALGLSTGLVYAPGSFAETREIMDLARVVARHGGLYVSHIRDERQELEAAIDEAIEIGRAARVPVLVSHLKAAERPNWGKIPRVIERIEAARTEGLPITFEVYPYTATSTKLRTFIPKAVLSDGVAGMTEKLRAEPWRQRSVDWLRARGTDFDAMVLITEPVPDAAGRSIQQVAEAYEQDPAHMVVDLLLRDPDTWIIYHCMDEADVDAAVLWDASIICSDSWSYPVNAPRQIGHPHPRTYGAFTRFLEQYALKRPRMSFGRAIRKITSYPARWLKLPLRGRIAEGYFADLVLLDPARVREKATFADPRRFSEGTEYVWVNGTLMLEQGTVYEKMPGRVLRLERPAPQAPPART
ncbi:MAG: amidohydrolase family protein [Rhodothermales bacterium]